MTNIKQQVKQGILTPLDALDKLRAEGEVNDRIEAWLLRKAGRLPTPPASKYHTTKKGKKGYNRKQKHESQPIE